MSIFVSIINIKGTKSTEGCKKRRKQIKKYEAGVNMINAVIFDMDGVIVDSEPLHFKAEKITMEYYGNEISGEELSNYVGVANPEMWAELKKKYMLTATLDEILEKQFSFKRNLFRSNKLKPIDGISELLQKLRSRGIRIALASSSSRELIELLLDKLGIKASFEVIVSGEEVKHSKPAPDIFLKAAGKLGIEPAYCLVIEDAKHGIKAAKLAGMYCIGFCNPNSGNQDLSLADAVVRSIYEVYPLINSWSL